MRGFLHEQLNITHKASMVIEIRLGSIHEARLFFLNSLALQNKINIKMKFKRFPDFVFTSMFDF